MSLPKGKGPLSQWCLLQLNFIDCHCYGEYHQLYCAPFVDWNPATRHLPIPPNRSHRPFLPDRAFEWRVPAKTQSLVNCFSRHLFVVVFPRINVGSSARSKSQLRSTVPPVKICVSSYSVFFRFNTCTFSSPNGPLDLGVSSSLAKTIIVHKFPMKISSISRGALFGSLIQFSPFTRMQKVPYAVLLSWFDMFD